MTAPLIAIFAALISPLLAYIVAARKLSGQIKTSEATDLWEESRSIREWSTNQVKDLQAKISLLETRLADVESENRTLKNENRDLRISVDRLQGGTT